MNLGFWFKEKIGIKRWIFLNVIAILMIAYGTCVVLSKRFSSTDKIFGGLLTLVGVVLMILAVTKIIKATVMFINMEIYKEKFTSQDLVGKVYEKKLLLKGPKIVVIGGGTGLSTMLRGLKKYTSNITAIVTVGDDGGGSGALREDLGILPPGDIRNCILALADTEPVMEELLQYRFKDGSLRGQSFGNLFLAAMDGISDNFMEAVQKVSSVLAVTGKVLPVTLENMKLKAVLENGKIVEGESNIPSGVIREKSPIDRIIIDPLDARALSEAVSAILDADAVVLGPGSLYTSVIPNLLVKGITDALENTSALKMYVCNIMTQKGESDKFTVTDHIKALQKHSSNYVVDYVIANTGEITKNLEEKYSDKGAILVSLNKEELEKLNIGVIEGNFVKIKNGYLRHDTEKLSSIIMESILEKNLQYKNEKINEFLNLSQILKKTKLGRE